MAFSIWSRIRWVLSSSAFVAGLLGDPPEGGPNYYLVGSRVAAKTPKHLGVVVEVMGDHEKANVWDWLADSS